MRGQFLVWLAHDDGQPVESSRALCVEGEKEAFQRAMTLVLAQPKLMAFIGAPHLGGSFALSFCATKEGGEE